MPQIVVPSQRIEAALAARDEARALPNNAWRRQLMLEREQELAEAYHQHDEAANAELEQLCAELEMA